MLRKSLPLLALVSLYVAVALASFYYLLAGNPGPLIATYVVGWAVITASSGRLLRVGTRLGLLS